MSTPYSTEVIQAACDLANAGKTLPEISRELGVSHAIGRRLKKLGVPIQRGKGRLRAEISDEIRDEVARLYVEELLGPTVLAARFDLPSYQTVYSILRQR